VSTEPAAEMSPDDRGHRFLAEVGLRLRETCVVLLHNDRAGQTLRRAAAHLLGRSRQEVGGLGDLTPGHSGKAHDRPSVVEHVPKRSDCLRQPAREGLRLLGELASGRWLVGVDEENPVQGVTRAWAAYGPDARSFRNVCTRHHG